MDSTQRKRFLEPTKNNGMFAMSGAIKVKGFAVFYQIISRVFFLFRKNINQLMMSKIHHWAFPQNSWPNRLK